MKKILAACLSLAMLCTLAACSSGSSTGSAADNTVSTTTESDASDSSADVSSAEYTISAAVYQSGSTLEASASGTFIDNFLTAVAAGENVELYLSFQAEEDATFMFNACPDGEYVATYCHDFATNAGDGVNSMYGGGSIAFSYEGYTGDFSEVDTLFIYMMEGDEFIYGDSFEIASVMISDSIFGGGGEYVDADGAGDAVADQDADGNSWAGLYIASNYEGEQMRASKEITLTENTITFSYDDIEYVLTYDSNALVTASELSNYGYGENNAAYASSNDKDYIIIFSDSDKRRIQICDVTLLASQNYLGVVLTYEENLYPDFDPAAEDWVGTYDCGDIKMSITQSQITIDFYNHYMFDGGESFTFAYDLASLQPSAIIGEDTANCLPVTVDGQDFIVCFEAPDSICLYIYDPLGYAYTSTTFNKD